MAKPQRQRRPYDPRMFRERWFWLKAKQLLVSLVKLFMAVCKGNASLQCDRDFPIYLPSSSNLARNECFLHLQKDSSVGKGACCLAWWWHEINLRNSHGGRKEQIPGFLTDTPAPWYVSLISTTYTLHTGTHNK